MLPKLRWKAFTPPIPSNPSSVDSADSVDEVAAPRRLGRPKGSRNRPKPTPTASQRHLNTSTASSPAPNINSAAQPFEFGNNEPFAFQIAVPRAAGVGSAPENSQNISTSHLSASTSAPASAFAILGFPAPSLGSVAPSTTTQHANSSSAGRNVLDRARQHVEEAPGSGFGRAPTAPLSHAPGLISDADSDDTPSLVHGDGLGQEEEDPDSDKPETKPEFPTWFASQFAAVRAKVEHAASRTAFLAGGTFWIRPKAAWYRLGTTNPTPSHLFSAEFFFWDPLTVLGPNFALACPKPGCSHHLTQYGFVDRPRRVVDIESCFWLVGNNYGCRSCGLRLRSWDARVLAKIPPELAAEFPAHLRHRSALSTRAFGVVRSCFQHGMGSAEVSDLFRMQHLRRYDELRLQYLQTKHKQMNSAFMSYTPFPAFTDHSENGPLGFSPSGQWFRDLYDTFMESKKDVLNQHTAMLSARICAIDHSHKLAKHVFKVDGVPIFTALLTVTNEKGEIRVCVFVATKSHSQFEDALCRLADDLVVYGHNLPEVFYTDNMVDKGMLEKIFPSLLEKVVPVDKYAHLPLFATLDFVQHPTLLDDEVMINNAMGAILDDVPLSGQIIVGFDSEWNVDMTQYGRFNGRSPPAVIQIAYKNLVYVLRVGEMLSRQHLPVQLVNLLRHAQVIKAGRQVNADLRQLAVAAGFPPDYFPGALDLAMFAKERFLVKKGTASLADLVASLLGQCLPKPIAERISSSWSDDDLTQAQLEYAARDAYASLCLYHEINKTPLPAPALAELPIGTAVLLLTDDNKKPAARGIISQNATLEKFREVNLTQTRTVITVQEVLVPAAIIGINKDENKNKLSLESFGAAPFDVLAHRAHVRLVSPLAVDPASNIVTLLPAEEANEDTGQVNAPDDLVSALEGLDDSDPDDSEPASATEAEVDIESQTTAARTLGAETLPNWASIPRSRVLKDIFHVFHMIYISRTHGLRLAFVHALRDACLIPHPADKARIEIYLATKNLTWADMLRYNPKWLWRHCRRTIPPPEELYPRVHRVFMLYGPLKDAKTGLPLFNAAAWKIAKNILELIRNGHVSDVPGVVLYYLLGFDTKAGGLPIYRCIRGTNMVEGGVHTHLLAKLPSRGASVRHMVACLLDFVLRHNLMVGHFNSTGRKYTGHDSIWLSNTIQELEITLGEHYGTMPSTLPWVNGNLYCQSKQTIGIVRIPASACEEVQIPPFLAALSSKQAQAYLAEMQGVQKPVLPVHTIKEKQLFSNLMRTSPIFQRCSTAISREATIEWNRIAATDKDIYYKLEEQLTSYFNGAYKDAANIRLSCARVYEQTSQLQAELQDPKRAEKIINAPMSDPVALQVTAGFIADEMSHVPSASEVQYVQQLAAATNVSEATANLTFRRSVKRTAESAAQGQPAGKKRQERTCIRCGRGAGCPGRSSWYMCEHNCRDCGERNPRICAGRYSKAPNTVRCKPGEPFGIGRLPEKERTKGVRNKFNF
uniref:3'-5' exonuclease domain-containing protein n=1 Tax=Mycena chlorophos TaxID=658473 RepID=A0ABQ0KUN7_MYCCL|nr:predicted protein [Mycena chlorophos]